MPTFDDAAFEWIGRSVRRTEDTRLLRGEGQFTDDGNAPGQLYAAMVRSPYPSARFVLPHRDQVSALPGVVGMLSGEDCHAHGLQAIAHNPLPATRFNLKRAGEASAAFESPHHLYTNRAHTPRGRDGGHDSCHLTGSGDSCSGNDRRTLGCAPHVTDAVAALDPRQAIVWDTTTGQCVRGPLAW